MEKEEEHLGFIVSMCVAYACFDAGHMPVNWKFVWHFVDPTAYSKKKMIHRIFIA